MLTVNNIIWSKTQSLDWLNCSPIGNGRLGAMVGGNILSEEIFLDEESIWAGCVTDNDRHGASKDIDEVRRLIFSSQYDKAREFAQEKLTGHFNNYGTHLRAGSVVLDFFHQNIDEGAYSRKLDMENGIVTIAYSVNGVAYQREYFASHIDNVLCMNFKADKPKLLNFSVLLKSERENVNLLVKNDTILLYANCHDNGVSFGIQLKLVVESGEILFDNKKITIRNADSAALFIDIQSSYRGKEFSKILDSNICSAMKKSYAKIKSEHIADFSSLFNRVSFKLDCEDYSHLPMEQRLSNFQKGNDDLDIIAKFFQFGRYLLISSSRPGTLAAHLQGIWNDNKAAMMCWTCDYHLDINTQMNYWPAEICNLSECHEPLFGLIESLVEPGRATAREQYNCRGWVAHVITNLWGFTSPGNSERWAFFPTGGLWIALQLVDHFKFTNDLDFLADKAYPVLKSSAEFFADFLVEDPENGWLLTCPATSEENVFQTKDGQHASVCAGPTCDNVLLRELFEFLIDAANTLNIDRNLVIKWQNILSKLPPFKIGKHGQLQEWLYDFDEPEPEHRHISHLLSAYPFFQITPESTPDFAEAVKKTLLRKMSFENWEAVGWNRAWNINIFARLGLAEFALDNIKGLLDIATSSMLTYSPPFGGAKENIFEMDGNTGGTAGIAEMLLQSNKNVIKLLPALPKQWHSGSIKGLKARGGFEVDIEWHRGLLRKAVVKSKDGHKCNVYYKGKLNEFATEKNRQYELDLKDFGIF
jgi:alpha-L-fucosidase 2